MTTPGLTRLGVVRFGIALTCQGSRADTRKKAKITVQLIQGTVKKMGAVGVPGSLFAYPISFYNGPVVCGVSELSAPHGDQIAKIQTQISKSDQGLSNLQPISTSFLREGSSRRHFQKKLSEELSWKKCS